MISDIALQEFKALWRKEFNEEISDEDAIRAGTDLLTLFNHLYRPVKKQWIESLDKKINNEN